MRELMQIACEPNPLAILLSLQKKEMCVGEIMKVIDSTQPATSAHLRVLRNARMVSLRRHGKRHYYSLHPETEIRVNKLLSFIKKN